MALGILYHSNIIQLHLWEKVFGKVFQNFWKSGLILPFQKKKKAPCQLVRAAGLAWLLLSLVSGVEGSFQAELGPWAEVYEKPKWGGRCLEECLFSNKAQQMFFLQIVFIGVSKIFFLEGCFGRTCFCWAIGMLTWHSNLPNKITLLFNQWVLSIFIISRIINLSR